MSEETYNGWTNRETWAVALHINNDQGWQESVHEALREANAETLPCGECGYGKDEHDDADHAYRASHVSAGAIIRENVEDVFDVETYGTLDSPEDCQNFVRRTMPILRDIGSLWRVNWTELGAAFLGDLEELDG